MWSNVWPNGSRARMEKENLKKKIISQIYRYTSPIWVLTETMGLNCHIHSTHFQGIITKSAEKVLYNQSAFVEYWILVYLISCVWTTGRMSRTWKIAFEEIGQVKMGPLWYIIETRMPVLIWTLKRIRRLTTSVSPMSRKTFPESLVEVQAPEWWLRRGFT